MKQFNIPEVEIIRFAITDIITTSNPREDEFPVMPVNGEEFPISKID